MYNLASFPLTSQGLGHMGEALLQAGYTLQHTRSEPFTNTLEIPSDLGSTFFTVFCFPSQRYWHQPFSNHEKVEAVSSYLSTIVIPRLFDLNWILLILSKSTIKH